jgi:hypothetical protein
MVRNSNLKNPASYIEADTTCSHLPGEAVYKLRLTENAAQSAQTAAQCYAAFTNAGYAQTHERAQFICGDMFLKEQAAEQARLERVALEQAEAERARQCPQLEEGATVLDGSTGKVYLVQYGSLRSYDPSSTIPPYKVYGKELQNCPKGLALPPSRTTSMPPPTPSAASCPDLVEGAVIIDSTNGALYIVKNKMLRAMSYDIYKQWGSPSYTPYTANALRPCARGPPMDPPVSTIAPTSIPTSAPPSVPTPPSTIRTPNVVVFIHQQTWMTTGKLLVMALRGGMVTLQSYAPEQPSQTFKVNGNGTIQNVDDSYVSASDGCTSVSVGQQAEGSWTFRREGSHPLSFRVLSSCGKALGNQLAGSVSVVTTDAPSAPSASWFVIPVGRLG